METKQKDDRTPFECSICKLNVKCKFGDLKFETSRYFEEVFYMRDPFEPPDIHKKTEDYSIDDFLVLGSICFICKQQICFDEACSIFYKHYYCTNCIHREKDSFPPEIIAATVRKLTAAKDD